jgi:hypothetical protein
MKGCGLGQWLTLHFVGALVYVPSPRESGSHALFCLRFCALKRGNVYLRRPPYRPIQVEGERGRYIFAGRRACDYENVLAHELNSVVLHETTGEVKRRAQQLR